MQTGKKGLDRALPERKRFKKDLIETTERGESRLTVINGIRVPEQ
jgi:hypothetical protein